ncbi:type II toxin-antitoxin system prevent-host-death family antitoxin [Methylopila sp. M107]|uniref:type II toxin-antitoxin system Phd/YefM family antitoxin n=1 Tax=Methylopila sp. M107 TaxID=1101190 RepID=UPI0018CA4B29|nr:type II toxin-antitoxin system prevent-host-death family antitoxin [Methylopila sp. M107]
MSINQSDRPVETMPREVQASDAKTHLPRLLTDVEKGETIVITRHGRAIARLVPAVEDRRSQLGRLKDEIAELRRSMPRLSPEDILSARDEGRRG